MSRRLPMVAIGIASVSFVVALVAVVVMIQRGSPAPVAAPVIAAAPVPPAPTGPTLVDVKATAKTVVDLMDGAHDEVKSGWRPDPATARALGLEPADLVVGISGRPTDRNFALHSVLAEASLGGAKRLYLEVLRHGTARVVRVEIEGDLQAAFGAKSVDLAARVRDPGLPGAPDVVDPFAPPAVDPDPLAALVAQIERVDDTHTNVPRAVLDAVLQNPMAVSKGARMVPAVKNGAPDGFKIYAVRPSSIFAALGLQNGDTIRGINGFEMTSADKALEVYTKLRDATSLEIELVRRGKPMTLSITLTK